MTDDLARTLRRIVGLALKKLLSDQQIRDELQTLATLLVRSDLPVDNESLPPQEKEVLQESDQSAITAIRTQEPSREALPELTLGQPKKNGPKTSTVTFDPKLLPLESIPASLDFQAVATRCRLKSEAAQWVLKKHRGNISDEEALELRRDLLKRVQEVQPCFLWMLHLHLPPEVADENVDNLASNFECMAEVLDAAAILPWERMSTESLREYFQVVAESQSALRVACLKLNHEIEEDQLAIYEWLRLKTREFKIYLARHMRAEEPADPLTWRQRIQRLRDFLQGQKVLDGRDKTNRKIWKNIRHKLTSRQVGEAIPEDEWQRIADLVNQLIINGVPPSHVEFRDYFLPVYHQIPSMDDPPDGFSRVIDALDVFVSSAPGTERDWEEDDLSTSTLEVAQAAALLKGRSLILIGGDERPHARRRLIAALKLSELHWIATRPHESIEGFKPFVGRPEVAAVLLAIRWASHSYGDVQRFCRHFQKPLVRLTRGFNPNQIAHEIMRQASRQLADSP